MSLSTPLLVLALWGCKDGATDDTATTTGCEAYPEPCVFVDPQDPDADLLEVVNDLSDGTTIVLGVGTFNLQNEVAINGVTDITLTGQGMDRSILDFSEMAVQGNGVFAVGDGFTIQDLTISNPIKDGLRIEDSEDITITRVRATWDSASSENGGYGLYPVRVRNVLLQDSEAFHAADAGIYVGQCTNAVVRNNLAKGNVAGIEIENTQYADVYGNTATDNTGGLVVFDLPGNPIVGHDVYIHDNTIVDNNRANFAPGGTVAAIPAGTGTFAMASRRVVITGNTYENNDSVDIALISGLIIESDPEVWALDPAELVGDAGKLSYDEADGKVYNFRTHDVYIHGNSYSGSGTNPDTSDAEVRELGFLLKLLFGDDPVSTVLYDGIGESAFSTTEASGNSNDNVICVGADTPSFMNFYIEGQGAIPKAENTYQPTSPFEPYNCSALTGGEIDQPDMVY
ncbi:MAG: parallel beta-helix domain-containing protein [Myxococcota bacterium]|nr:parallel beta-helix domain-containing protein [Myxococcota bacterium]